MVFIPKVVGIVSCGFLLCLGLSVNAASAAERMKPDPSADRKGSLPGLVKSDEETLQGISTIKGEVLRIEGENYFVQRFDGKEVSLHTDQTTQKTGNIQQGDRIEAKVNDVNHALSIEGIDAGHGDEAGRMTDSTLGSNRSGSMGQ